MNRRTCSIVRSYAACLGNWALIAFVGNTLIFHLSIAV